MSNTKPKAGIYCKKCGNILIADIDVTLVICVEPCKKCIKNVEQEVREHYGTQCIRNTILDDQEYHRLIQKRLNNMKYRKKPVVVEATQWFENGDHPEDDIQIFRGTDGKQRPSEGKIVRYFRAPDIDGGGICSSCKDIYHNHGWIDALEGGHIVCPGDWVITGIQGEKCPCKNDIFEETYEKAE